MGGHSVKIVFFPFESGSTLALPIGVKMNNIETLSVCTRMNGIIA